MIPAALTELDFSRWVDGEVAKVQPWTMEQRVFVRRCFPGEWSTFIWGRPALWPLGDDR